MKNQLICQTTDYDCGPTSLTNALRFLYEREEIPPVLLKRIWEMGNDSYSKAGEPGKAGTSKEALRYLAHWFTEYGERCGFPLRARFLDMGDAAVEAGGEVPRCLDEGGCAVARCVINGGSGHYVLLTRALDGGRVGLFDPYDGQSDSGDPAVQFVEGRPGEMNRAVFMSRMNETGDADYSMGPPEKRELLLLWPARQSAEPEREGQGAKA